MGFGSGNMFLFTKILEQKTKRKMFSPKFSIDIESFGVTGRTETIKEETSELNTLTYDIANPKCLADQICHLILDILFWYKRRYENYNDRDEMMSYEDNNFFSVLYMCDRITVAVVVSYKEFYERKYKEKEKLELLNFDSLSIEDLIHDPSLKNVKKRIRRWLEKEFSKALPFGKHVANYVDFCITYNLEKQ